MAKSTTQSSKQAETKKAPRKTSETSKKRKRGPSIDVGGPPGIEGHGVSVGSAKGRATED